jgi:methionine-S-sulfoxide reductase
MSETHADKGNVKSRETAVLAAGCFWGVQKILRAIPGVLETEVGYAGGTLENPTYHDVTRGDSGHAEAVRVVFNPTVISFEALLGYFFRLHDPTTLNRQGNDRGSQYRSAVFYCNNQQKETALRVIGAVNESDKWRDPVVTEVVAAGPFYSAEEYHQDYLQKNPGGYSCHFLRD